MRSRLTKSRAALAMRTTWLMTVLLTGLMAGACHDEPKPPREPTLSNAWPNQDRRAWTYELTASQWSTLPVAPFPAEVVFATHEEVPAAPTLAEAASLLDEQFTGTPVASDQALYTLQFLGTTTTESGARGQNLVATLDGEPLLAKSAAVEGLEAGTDQALLVRVALARPDLRARIQARLGSAHLAEIDPLPLFLRDGVWEKTEDWIGRYGDLSADLAWLYLEADLDVGHEFTLQLVPELAEDVFLHGRVHGRVTVENEVGTYPGALEVIYQIDYGGSEVTDINGEVQGYARLFDLARIVYAAGVGPVESEERALYMLGEQSVQGPWATLEILLHHLGLPR